MHRLRIMAVFLIICAASCAFLPAENPAGYTRHLWQAPDGLPEQTIQAFAQTPDGYLWIGTTGGLLRFDGSSFQVFDRQNTPALHENSIFCLLVSRDGALWIGTEGGGLLRYLHGQFRTWSTHEGMSNDFVRALAQDADGAIWAGTDNGLLRFTGDRPVRADATPQVPLISVHAIYQDRDGDLWVGGSSLLRVHHNVAAEYALGKKASQRQVKSIVQTRDGSIWVGTVFGLNRMLPGKDQFEPVEGIRGTVRVLRQTPDNNLWIGTIGKGIYQFNAGKLSQLTAPTALPSNTVLNFFEDRENNFWIGTQAGMLRLSRSPVSVVSLPQANDSDFGTIYQDHDGSFWIGSTLLFQMRNGIAMPQNLPGLSGIHVRNVVRDRAGALWVGTDGDGVFRIADGHTTRFANRDGLVNNFIRSLTQDRDGSMWVTTDGDMSHILAEGSSPRIVNYRVKDGLAYSSIRALQQDRQNDIWVGTDRGLSHMHSGKFIADAATTALSQMKVWAIHEDKDGGLWFGTRDNGLYRYRNGKVAHFSTQDGLASNAIYQILEDAAGHFWMSGPNGISMLLRKELDAQADTYPRHFALTFYSIAEMEGNTEIYGGTQSSGSITAEGDVWFPSSRGPIHIRPLPHSSVPPPLRIQTVLADGRPFSTSDRVILGPGNGRLEFAYAPIRLSSQNGLRFRYRLDGFDTDWSASTAVRTADYTNLPPGQFRFRVQVFEVGNPDAVTEASMTVAQMPHFYRTWWFIALVLMLLAVLIYVYYQHRVSQVRSRFEAVLEERSRLAREMHDTVIQGCTGVSALIEAVSMEDAKRVDRTGLLDFARLQLRSTINEAREAIWNLRQSDDETGNIGEKIESMTQQVSAEFHIPISYTMSGTPFALTHPLAHDLLMVAREAVFNSALHGGPSLVDVQLAYDHKTLTVTVSDNGCGFEVDAKGKQRGHHFGLRGMQERVERCGGSFHLTTSPGKGVRIEAKLTRRG